MNKSCLLILAGIAIAAQFLTGCGDDSLGPTVPISLAVAHTEAGFTFAVLGDRTGQPQSGVYSKAIQDIKALSPDLVFTVGDMIDGYSTDTTRVRRQWEEYLAILRPLSAPVYFTPGNHDIWDDASLSLYKEYAGEPMHSITAGGAHFVVLDNSRWPNLDSLPPEHIDWLERDLRMHMDSERIFVFMHHPYWSYTRPNAIHDKLHSIFARYRVDAVFTGHTHIPTRGWFNGIQYIGVGSSGGYCPSLGDMTLYQFIWVTVNRNGVLITPMKISEAVPELLDPSEPIHGLPTRDA